MSKKKLSVTDLICIEHHPEKATLEQVRGMVKEILTTRQSKLALLGYEVNRLQNKVWSLKQRGTKTHLQRNILLKLVEELNLIDQYFEDTLDRVVRSMDATATRLIEAKEDLKGHRQRSKQYRYNLKAS